MSINFTLLIQIFHFFVAYLIISKILLKRAIGVIQMEEKIEGRFQSLIKSEEFTISKKETEKNFLWANSLQQFELQKPKLDVESKVFINWSKYKPIPVSNDTILNLKRDLTNFIVDKVKNVE